LKTFNITKNGNIYDNIYNNSLIFTSDTSCYQPRIIEASEGVYAIVYPTGEEQGNSMGKLITVKIENNGTIARTITTLLNEIGDRPNKFFEPDIIRVGSRVFAIVYRESDPHDGKLTTVIIGEDQTPAWERGIVKGGSASIYANMTHLVGSINGEDHVLTLPINSNDWNHVVLTFDGTIIRLYSNFGTIDDQNNPNKYTEEEFIGRINENPEKLLFGYLFSGLIDEIGIFDHAITPDEILYHQSCIGCYEV
jgi:hypothetical protein